MWEQISKSIGTPGVATDRLAVPGGWVIRTITYIDGLNGKSASVHQVYVPGDTLHTWQLTGK